MKINLYKVLPIFLIIADLIIYVIDSEIQVARFLTVIALIILLINDFKIKKEKTTEK
jgi:hypothetical protein